MFLNSSALARPKTHVGASGRRAGLKALEGFAVRDRSSVGFHVERHAPGDCFYGMEEGVMVLGSLFL